MFHRKKRLNKTLYVKNMSIDEHDRRMKMFQESLYEMADDTTSPGSCPHKDAIYPLQAFSEAETCILSSREVFEKVEKARHKKRKENNIFKHHVMIGESGIGFGKRIKQGGV